MKLLGRDIGLDQPLFLIAGPCVVESYDLQARTAETLKAGQVDLWPVLADVPERRSWTYVSDTWMLSDHYLISRDASPLRIVCGAGNFVNGSDVHDAASSPSRLLSSGVNVTE